jgi:cell division inhibitor SepF
MGSWRKVGAFLGLVPDDNHPYDDEHAPDGQARYDGSRYDESRYDGGYDAASYDWGQYDPAGYGSADDELHAENGYAGSSPAEYGHENDSNRSAGRGDRAGRRGFSSEPVTQGALAMKADQRRESDSSTAARPASVKLTGFGEARIVGEKYRDGQSVILDMTDMSDADARRLVDFSAGLAFSLRGSIEKVAPKVFMLLPAEADIAGGAAHALEDARAYVGGYAGR